MYKSTSASLYTFCSQLSFHKTDYLSTFFTHVGWSYSFHVTLVRSYAIAHIFNHHLNAISQL